MTGYLRVRRRALQSAVVQCQYTRAGRVVTLVGTSHVGEKAYYERLRVLVADLAAAGATVRYEEGDGPAPEAGAASGGGRAVQPAPRDPILAASPYRGWVRQPLQLGTRPAGEWQNLQEPQANGVVAGDDALTWAVGLGVLTRLATLDRFGLMARMILRGEHRVIIVERNRAALATLPPEGDAVLVWGAAHLPGLEASLRKAGFRRLSAEWVTIGTVPALWPSARAIWRALRSPEATAG